MTIFSLRRSTSPATSVWMRWMPIWHFLFYLALISTTSIAIIDDLPARPYIFQLIVFLPGSRIVVRNLCHNIPLILARTSIHHNGILCCGLGNLV